MIDWTLQTRHGYFQMEKHYMETYTWKNLATTHPMAHLIKKTVI